jgi:hypothetical protein
MVLINDFIADASDDVTPLPAKKRARTHAPISHPLAMTNISNVAGGSNTHPTQLISREGWKFRVNGNPLSLSSNKVNIMMYLANDQRGFATLNDMRTAGIAVDRGTTGKSNQMNVKDLVVAGLISTPGQASGIYLLTPTGRVVANIIAANYGTA